MHTVMTYITKTDYSLITYPLIDIIMRLMEIIKNVVILKLQYKVNEFSKAVNRCIILLIFKYLCININKDQK